jgi:hypothetical protein
MLAGTGKQLITIFGDSGFVLFFHPFVNVALLSAAAVMMFAAITGDIRQKKRQVTIDIEVVVKRKN